jgi:hypothetical protein
MKVRKKDNEKKIKFTICIDPKIHKKMDEELINKSKLIEKLLKEFYDKKDL